MKLFLLVTLYRRLLTGIQWSYHIVQCLICSRKFLFTTAVTAQALADSGIVTSASDDDEHANVPEHCNCNGRMGPCPLDGDCQKERSCIYCCKVTRQDTQEYETYTGLARGTFKSRFYGHNASMYNKRQKQTTLSNHVWDLKDNNIPHEIKWTILAKA